VKFVKSTLIGTGSFVLAGLILTLFAPKAANALVATLVQVANPAITQSADAYNAFQTTVAFNWAAGSPSATQPLAIPAGQRLVIDFISISAYGAGAFAPFVVLNPVLNGAEASSSSLAFNPAVIAGSGAASFSQATKIYADSLTFYAGSNTAELGFGFMLISGHLVAMP
jgi:hypothetical protein